MSEVQLKIKTNADELHKLLIQLKEITEKIEAFQLQVEVENENSETA